MLTPVFSHIPRNIIQLVCTYKFTELYQISSNLDDPQSFYVDFCNFVTFNIKVLCNNLPELAVSEMLQWESHLTYT